MRAHVPADAGGQERSVAGRFALIAAAGELARAYGVLPWPEGEAMRAAGACFEAWLVQRGGVGAAEDAAAIRQVRAFLELHGASRFTTLDGDDQRGRIYPLSEVPTVNRAGFKRKRFDVWEYLILPIAWAEIFQGLDPSQAARALDREGHLIRDDDGKHLARKESLPGHGRTRVHVVRGTILGGCDHE